MGQEAGALELKTEALAQRGAGKAVKGTSRVLVVENEGVGEQALDGAGIDISLVRHLAALAQTAPVTHQQVRILVFHGPIHLCSCRLLRNGTLREPPAGLSAKAVPAVRSLCLLLCPI